MRAMVVHEPGPADVFKLESIPDPTPEPTECVVKVIACGVCMHDVVTRNGVMKRGVVMPVICGHEIAGEVAEVGSRVTKFKIGDRVTTTQRRHICGHCEFCRSGRETWCEEKEFLGDVGLNGGYAEYVLLGQENMIHVPDNVSLEEASIVACAVGTEYNAIVSTAKLLVGETCLITGAGGGLGIHGIQIAAAAGAEVVATTTSPEKADLCKQAGATHVVVYGRGEDFSKQVLEVTGGRGADVAIDNVGSVVFHAVRKSMAYAGRWVFVGQLGGDFVSFSPAQFFFRGLTAYSASSTSRAQLLASMELVARGKVRPMVTKSFKLEDAARAHLAVEAGNSAARFLIKPWD